MDGTGTPDRRATAPRGWTRTPLAQQSGGSQRHSVDPAHRGAVGRSAGAVPAVSDLPPPLPTLGPRWHPRADPGGAGPRPPGAWPVGSVGMLHRWHLHRRQERGGCVGATKRGKGTKLLAMADRFGLPLAACAASATPHESRLVAARLDSLFVADLPRRLIGDRAYDADPLDDDLAKRGDEMIAPYPRNRNK